MQSRHDELPDNLENEVVKLISEAEALYKKGLTKEAIKHLTEAITLSPNSIDSYALRAGIYKDLEQDTLAINDLSEIITIDKTNINAFSERSELYKKLHDNTNALADLTSMINIESKNAKHYSERGVIYGRLNLDSEAIEDFTNAILINPDASGPFFFRALIYKKLGESKKAISDLTSTIERDPNESYLYKNRGQLYSRSGMFSHAVEDYIKAIKLDDSDFSNCVNLTKNYILNNDFGMAQDILNTHSENAPKIQDKIMVSFYGSIVEKLTGGEPQKALECFTNLVDSSEVQICCFLDDITLWLKKSDELNGAKKTVDIATTDSPVRILIIPTDEELMIARDSLSVIKA